MASSFAEVLVSSTPIAARSRVYAPVDEDDPSRSGAEAHSDDHDDDDARGALGHPFNHSSARQKQELDARLFDRSIHTQDLSPIRPMRHHRSEQRRNHKQEGVQCDDHLADSEEVFDLTPVQPATQQLSSFVAAARDVTETHHSLITAVNRLTAAARRQHEEFVGLSAQHQRLAVRVDTVWQTAVEVREEANTLTNTVQRHLRYADETHRHFHAKFRLMEDIVQTLSRRLVRTTAVAHRSAVMQLDASSRKRLATPFFGLWLRRSRLAKATRALTLRTRYITRQRAMRGWRLFVKFREHHVTLRRCIETLRYTTATNAQRTCMHGWMRWAAERRSYKRKLLSLSFFGGKALQKVYYGKLLRHAREARTNRIKALFLGTQSKKHRMRHAYTQWVKAAMARRNRIRNLRLVAALSHHAQGQRLRGAFSHWRLVLEQNFRKRRGLVEMRRRNTLRVVRGFYEQWRHVLLKKWILREVRAEVVQLTLKMDIAMRTTSNTSETISKMMEHQHELEAKVLEMLRTKVSVHQLRTSAFKESFSRELDHPDQYSGLLGSGQIAQLETAAAPPLPPPHRSSSVAAASSSSYVPLHRNVSESRRESSAPGEQPYTRPAPSPLALHAAGLGGTQQQRPSAMREILGHYQQQQEHMSRRQ